MPSQPHICIPTTSKILYHYLKHIPLSKIWRNFEKIKLNEPGRQKQGRYKTRTSRSLVSRHSIQSYILTYYRLRQRESLKFDSTGLPPGGLLISASMVPYRGATQMKQFLNPLPPIATHNPESVTTDVQQSYAPTLVNLFDCGNFICSVHAEELKQDKTKPGIPQSTQNSPSEDGVRLPTWRGN